MLIMEGQNPQFVIHLMFRSHVAPNLARQLYGELEQIAEEEAPSTYTPRPAIESAPNDESYVILW